MQTEEHFPELGNLMFGHSRGEYPIPRTEAFEEPFYELLEALDLNAPYGTVGERTPTQWVKSERYRSHVFDNGVFVVRSYWWSDCMCGQEEAETAWDEAHHHASDCYQPAYRALRERWPSGWMLQDPNHAYYEEELKALLRSHQLPYRGHGVHCTCPYSQEWVDFANTHRHADDCPIVQPNFEYRPSGLCVMWYKFAMRDAYSNLPLDAGKWTSIMRECRRSIGAAV